MIKKHIQSILLLIEYIDANKDMFDSPKELFAAFVRRLYSGTIGDDGLDPSNLYWIPSSPRIVAGHIGRLTRFTDFMHEKGLGARLNEIRTATPHEERLAYAAWSRKNQNDFLGHIEDKHIGVTAKQAREIKGRFRFSTTGSSVPSFPSHKFEDLYFKGYGKTKDRRITLRDRLILLLMHFAGLRCSEALLVWITDVFEDHKDSDIAVVRVYNEVVGLAPFENSSSRKKSGKKRLQFLKEKYNRIPREYMSNTEHLGWKTKTLKNTDGYLDVYFFPIDFARVFMSLWREYTRYRAELDVNHPYAFVSFHKQYIGRPYTYSSFMQNYASALRRIELEPNKTDGLDPHGHRHNYARRLISAGISPFYIQKCLHHASIESQLVYTDPDASEVSDALTLATSGLNLDDANKKIRTNLEWKNLLEHGFNDIDPQGLFSGKNPKFKRK